MIVENKKTVVLHNGNQTELEPGFFRYYLDLGLLEPSDTDKDTAILRSDLRAKPDKINGGLKFKLISPEPITEGVVGSYWYQVLKSEAFLVIEDAAQTGWDRYDKMQQAYRSKHGTYNRTPYLPRKVPTESVITKEIYEKVSKLNPKEPIVESKRTLIRVRKNTVRNVADETCGLLDCGQRGDCRDDKVGWLCFLHKQKLEQRIRDEWPDPYLNLEKTGHYSSDGKLLRGIVSGQCLIPGCDRQAKQIIKASGIMACVTHWNKEWKIRRQLALSNLQSSSPNQD